jgi:uncharacterized protein
MNEKYIHIKEIVEKELGESSHGIDHTIRVYNMCILLANKYLDVNIDVLKTSALLHDIAREIEDNDDSGMIDHAIYGGDMSKNILKGMGYNENDIKKIVHCIETHRFKSNRKPNSIEAKILFDADKLDVIGAIGIARSFMFAGKYGQKMFSNVDIGHYKKNNLEKNGRIKDITICTPNIEFKTKVLNIPNRLFTDEAKKIACERIEYTRQFFNKMIEEMDYKNSIDY